MWGVNMRVDAFRAIAQVLNLDAKNLTSQVKTGDVLSVQVLGLSKDEVVLRLPDGKVISANTQIPLDISIGEFINLMVKDKQGGKIFLETLKSNPEQAADTVNDEQIKNILTSLKLNMNARNIDIVKEMIGREIPVNKQNVQVILNNLAKYPELNVQKAVFMTANGVAFEEKSIDFLNQYAESKIALGNQIKSLLNHIDNIDDAQVLKNILDKLNWLQSRNNFKGNEETAAVVLSETGNSEAGANKEIKQSTVKGYSDPIMKEPKLSDAIINKQNAFINLQKEILPLIKQIVLNNVDKQLNIQQTFIPDDSQQDINNFKQMIQNIEPDQLEAFIQKLPQREKVMILQLLKGEDFNLNTNNTSDPADILHLKTQIKSMFERHFVSNTSEHLIEDLHVKDSYKEILVKLDVLKESLISREGRGDILNLIGQTEENIRFMNNLSQFNTFVQIPLNIWGQNTNGQLFVLKKSKKKIDASNASIFLSLEMPNMGLTEVLVNVMGKSVFCSFRVKDQKALELIRKHTAELTAALNNKGYNTVDINCGMIQQRTSLLEMDKASEEFTRGKRLSFDIRV